MIAPGGLSGIDAETALTDLRVDPFETRQKRDSVRAADFSLTEKVVAQLAITLDPAALSPCV